MISFWSSDLATKSSGLFVLLMALLALTFLILQYRLWVGEGSLPALWQLQQQLQTQQQHNRELGERNQVLRAQVDDLKQGLEALEARARSDLGMIKRDETFYQIVEVDSGQNRAKSNRAKAPVSRRGGRP